jgi:O-antigen/teichoic acid export membrane protein
MFSKDTILTISSKFIILLVNFALVLFTTRTWGSEGRGEIALVFSNITILTILGYIFCGSTISYHSRKYQRDFLLIVSIAGALIISTLGSLIFSVIFGFRYFFILLLISFLMSLTTAISSYWLGKNNIFHYNFLSLIGPVIITGALLVLYFTFRRTDLNTYYYAYFIGTLIVLAAGIIMLVIKEPFRKPVITSAGIKSILGYGISNEFSHFLLFLNNRLPYYFITAFLGLGKLGVFSIVVSISEAVWIISNSMSAVLFSKVINSDDILKNRKDTIAFAKQCLLVSTLLILGGILIPDYVYRLIFGNEFTGIQKYLLYMSPGIIATSASNLYSRYFGGTGRLNILRNESLLGLLVSIILLPLLVKKYQLTGACISMNISYLASAIYLWFVFSKEANLSKT